MKRLLLVFTPVAASHAKLPGMQSAHSFASPHHLSKISFLFFLLVFISLFSLNLNGQSVATDTAYWRTIKDRAAKIIAPIEIQDAGKYEAVLKLVMNQYFQLNTIHEEYKSAVQEVKAKSLVSDELVKATKTVEEKKTAQLRQQHAAYLSALKGQLQDNEIEIIKDGMTYKVFPNTYTAYLDMLPALSNDQKNQIYTWLKEARELAMDEGTSDDKHKVFGKYKGKINNYLSAAGFDMKKEGEEWQKRIKERKENKQSQ
jgi:hypothetical protein